MSLYDSPSSLADFLAKVKPAESAVTSVGAGEPSLAESSPATLTTPETGLSPKMENGRTLHDSVYAVATPARKTSARKPSGRNLLDYEPPPNLMTATQIALLGSKSGNVVHSESTATVNEAESSPGPALKEYNGGQVAEPVTLSLSTNEFQDESVITHEVGAGSQAMPTSASSTPVSSPIVSGFKPHISITSPIVSPTPVTVHGEPSTESLEARSIVLKHAADILASKIAVVKIESKEEGKHEEENKSVNNDANREHAVYFSAWGTPEARSKIKSCVRKVILSGLPGNVDFTFVQALVHGGTIEDMTLNASGGVAYVLFTTGISCDKYADMYPNGIEFKHKGRKLTIFVDKGKEVDVISSMSEAYLAAGASRVVKACNVDEDWSMRALRHIAEGGSKQKRKVEYISDEFRNEVRNVIFRFVNITDAVSFHNTLRRSSEWEGAEIQFGADPCEKAEGFHFE